MRKTDIDVIGELSWGAHFCQFYQTKDDLVDILVPYFKAGLESNEFCMWVTSQPLEVEEAEESLRKVLPELDYYLKEGQIEIISYTEWYLKDGVFDSKRVLNGWVEKLDSALENGYDGLRLTGNTFWLEKDDWGDFTDYEEEVDRILGNYNIISLCTYCLDKCNATEIIDVVANHQFALIKREGKWERIESSKRKKMEEKVQNERNRLKNILDGMDDGVCIINQDYEIEYVNPVIERNFGEIKGKCYKYFHNKKDKCPSCNIQEVLEGKTKKREQYFSKTDKSFDLFNTPFINSDGSVSALQIFHDVTYRKKVEKQKELLLEQVQEFAEELQLSNEGLREQGEELADLNRALRRSERSVRLKLDNILSPEGDVGKLDLADMIDVQATQTLMDKFYKLLQIPLAIIDLEGNMLVGVGWQDICTQFHRVNPKTRNYCIESDIQLSRGVSQGEFKLYKCMNNMWDVATPIFVGGKHLGNFFSGQFFFDDEKIDYEFFKNQARKYNFNEEKYISALKTVPRLSRQTVVDAMDFFVEFSEMMSKMSYNNIKLARSLSERENLMSSLNKTMEKLQKSNSELEQFAYVASHDLQEPLRMISNFLQLLKKRYEGQLDSDADEFIGFAVDGAKRMQILINDLLAYSRVTSKDEAFENVNLEKVLDEVLFNLEIDIEKNQAIIKREPLPEIHADYSQMVQVFQNLVGNALKYRSDEKPEIFISTKKEHDHWLFAVKDNGIGIESEYFPQIFQIFRRLHTHDEYEGTGIGLAITKRIIEHHQGKISVESEPEKGSTFYFTIPCKE